MARNGLRVPAGLAGALVLAAALEVVVFRTGDGVGSFIASSWRESGRAASAEAVNGSVLCLGDSQVKCGILPPVLTDRLGLPAYNLAVVGGQASSTYFLLERALRAGARPRAIVVDFYPGLLAADLGINTRQWPELLGPAGCLDLLWTTREFRQVAPVLLGAVLPSLRGRDQVRAGLLALVTGVPDPQSNKARAYRRNWRLNGGAHALPQNLRFVDDLDTGQPASSRRWKVKPGNLLYLRKFLMLAAANEIPVFWLLPTNSPGARALRERQGLDAAYNQFVRRTQAEFPGLTVLDSRPALADASVFSDPCHLDRRGAVALSLAVADAISSALSGADLNRWVVLERRRATELAEMEDVGQSAAALRSGEGEGVVRIAAGESEGIRVR